MVSGPRLTVLTDVGLLELRRRGSVRRRTSRRSSRSGTAADRHGRILLFLPAKGLTCGENSSHLAEVYGAEVSKQTISTITDLVMEDTVE